jgi:hypothetical protein
MIKDQAPQNTRIAPCSCEHAFQDARYGKGNRVMNPTKEKKTHRCTVCGKTHVH